LAAQIQVKYQKRLGVDEVHIQTAEAEVARAQHSSILQMRCSHHNPRCSRLSMERSFLSISPLLKPWYRTGRDRFGRSFQLSDRNHRLERTGCDQGAIGQPAKVFIEALNEEFSGKVIDVDRVSSTLGGDVVYTVTIELDTQPQGLLWGMSADVQIETAE
jgi:hypothetical protein